jgi:hypoxanthine-guanine phosphoribosyltransferase
MKLPRQHVSPAKVMARVREICDHIVAKYNGLQAETVTVVVVTHSAEWFAHWVIGALSMAARVRVVTDQELRHLGPDDEDTHFLIVDGHHKCGGGVYLCHDRLKGFKTASVSLAVFNDNRAHPKTGDFEEPEFACFAVSDEYVGCGESVNGWFAGLSYIGERNEL